VVWSQAHGIAKATGHTDTSTPKVAWGHRKQRDAYRAGKFTDPVYVNTGGYEVQWSQQEATVARRYMDMHERAINTTSYVNTRMHPRVEHFRKWRDRQREAVAAPISVPMGDLYASQERRKKARQQARAAKEATEGAKGGGVSKQSQLLLDQMASRVGAFNQLLPYMDRIPKIEQRWRLGWVPPPITTIQPRVTPRNPMQPCATRVSMQRQFNGWWLF